MPTLIAPHGGGPLKPLMLTGETLVAERARAQRLPTISISSREKGDLIMLGIGGFTPLGGFMGQADWQGVCDRMQTSQGLFWPIPITLSTDAATADSMALGTEVALADPDGEGVLAIMRVDEKYRIDKTHECLQVFKTADAAHPGVRMVMDQGDVNLAGPLREHGLAEAWVIAIPASIGVVQVFGRLLLYFFERHLDLHFTNRLIPCLIPLGLLALLAAPSTAGAHFALVLAFVALWGMGNGMLTIVNGTVIAEYVNREHVATLNGALGIPLALARAAAPLGLGLLWSPQNGYTLGLTALLCLSLLGIGALAMAQKFSTKRRIAIN